MNIISWSHISEFLDRKITAQIPAYTNSEIYFLINGLTGSFTLRVPLGSSMFPKLTPYDEIDFSERIVNGNKVVEITVIDQKLHRTFYLFSIEIIEQIILNPGKVADAILIAFKNWASILTRRIVLGPSEQLGLIGELIFLHAMILSRGPASVNSWLGPSGSEHDFRFDKYEVEVKSTIKHQRIHHINGLGQLDASPGMKLYLLSFQLELAGTSVEGRALPEWIDLIRSAIEANVDILEIFNTSLRTLGYIDELATMYEIKYKMRSAPVLIPIDEDFPKLSRSNLFAIASPHRIQNVEYSLNLEGMGWPAGTSEFANAINITQFWSEHVIS